MIPGKKCEACGRKLYVGSTGYNVRIEVLSDFDGFLPDYREKDDLGAARGIMENLEHFSTEKLEEDVHVEIEMVLCRNCKKKLLDQLDNFTDGATSTTRAQRPSLH